MMTLIEDWDAVLRRAWSVKFNVAAAFFSCGEVIAAVISPGAISPGLLAGIGAAMSVCAVVARALAQPEDAKEIADEVVEEMKHEPEK